MKTRNLETKDVRPIQIVWTTPPPGEQHQVHAFNNWLGSPPAAFELAQSLRLLLLPAVERIVPRIQVYYDHTKSWWELPIETGFEIYWNLILGKDDLTYSCETGKGQRCKSSEYVVDLSIMKTRNLETERFRPIQIVWSTPPPGEQHHIDAFKNWLSSHQAAFELSR